MTPEQRLQIEQQCQRLVIAFANYNDAGEFEKLAAQFTEDALFARPTAPDDFIEGRQAIMESFQSRPASRVARHLLSNMLIDVEDEHTASGICYALLYTGAPDNQAELGLHANPKQLVGDFGLTFRHTDEGWKISRLRGEIVFTSE